MKKDIVEKRLEDHNDVFADIFNNLLFDGKDILRAEDLTSLPTEGHTRDVAGKIHENRCDIRKADRKHNVYRLVCGIENQSGVDYTMPERVMGYDYAAYECQIKTIMNSNKEKKHPAITKRIHEDQKLAPVVTAVLYWGDEAWDGPVRLHDMLEFPDETEDVIRPLVPDYPINLVDVRRLPLEVRKKLTSDFGLIAEYVAGKQDPERLEALMQDNVHTIKHLEEFLDLLSEVAKDKQYKEVVEKLSKANKEDVTMCVIADKLVNKGREQGLERGKLLLISTLLNNGRLQFEEAARYLDMPADTLRMKLLELERELA